MSTLHYLSILFLCSFCPIFSVVPRAFQYIFATKIQIKNNYFFFILQIFQKRIRTPSIWYTATSFFCCLAGVMADSLGTFKLRNWQDFCHLYWKCQNCAVDYSSSLHTSICTKTGSRIWSIGFWPVRHSYMYLRPRSSMDFVNSEK